MINISITKLLLPVITFISFILVGVFLANSITDDPLNKFIIILMGFIVGGIFAYYDFKAMIRRQKLEQEREKIKEIPEEERKKMLAKYVAELFNEDIPELKD